MVALSASGRAAVARSSTFVNWYAIVGELGLAGVVARVSHLGVRSLATGGPVPPGPTLQPPVAV